MLLHGRTRLHAVHIPANSTSVFSFSYVAHLRTEPPICLNRILYMDLTQSEFRVSMGCEFSTPPSRDPPYRPSRVFSLGLPVCQCPLHFLCFQSLPTNIIHFTKE